LIENLGIELIPVELPKNIPIGSLAFILSVEAAAAFDELTRSDRDSLLVRQIRNAWPNVFRASRFIPAVEYVQANRIRYVLLQRINEIFKGLDVIITPSFAGDQLLMTNLTGHPCVVVPNGFNTNGGPTSITFLGNLYDEGTILLFANKFQEVTDFDEQHPPLFMP
jgi:Asp-tRNA(Asn)/Glu-tRNA(Gln) amidotransferase A subunit family amidase